MTTLYHVVPRRFLGSIKKRGLVPRKSPEALVEDPATFLGVTPKEAVEWASYNAATGRYGFTEPMAILAVRDPESFEEDPEAFGMGGSYFTTWEIPPENIRVVGYLEPGTYHYPRTRYAEKKISSLKSLYTDLDKEVG